MFSSNAFGARNADLQSTLVSLHSVHYHVREDVAAVLLHDDFHGEALRGEFYATSYLRHRIPLLFRLALYMWKPRQRKPSPANGTTGSASPPHRRTSRRGASPASAAAMRAHHHRRYARRSDDGSGANCRSASSSSSSSSSSSGSDDGDVADADCPTRSNGEGCSSGVVAGDGCTSSDSTAASEAKGSDTSTAAGAGGGGTGAATLLSSGSSSSEKRARELSPEQLTQLAMLAVQVLCGDRSRVREGSSEASTASCGPVWDVHTVRNFFEEHRRLIQWTSRVLKASCEWVETAVNRALEDELLAAPAPATGTEPTPPVTQYSSGYCSPYGIPSPVTAVPPVRPASHLLASSSPPPQVLVQPTAGSASATAAGGAGAGSTVHAVPAPLLSISGADPLASVPSLPSSGGGSAPWRLRQRLPNPSLLLAAGHPSGPYQCLSPVQRRTPLSQRSTPSFPSSPVGPLPPLAPLLTGSSGDVRPHRSGSSYATSTTGTLRLQNAYSPLSAASFVCTAELEAALELQCRRIRHALMLLESLLVAVVMVQSFLYRHPIGESPMLPWLRRDGGGTSSSTSGIADFNGTDDEDDEDDAFAGGGGAGGRSGLPRTGRGGGGLGPGARYSSTAASRRKCCLCHSTTIHRTTGTGSFFPSQHLSDAMDVAFDEGVDDVGDEEDEDALKLSGPRGPADAAAGGAAAADDGGDGGDAAADAEATEPPLNVLVRHAMHAFTHTFLSITTVQQRLQEYSHERRHTTSSSSAATTTASAAAPAAASAGAAGTSAAVAKALATRSFTPLVSQKHSGTSDVLSPLSASASGAAVNSSLDAAAAGAPRGGHSSTLDTPDDSNNPLGSPAFVAARDTPAAYACAKCQRFHQVEELLIEAVHGNLEVLKKSAIAFAAHHSAIAEEAIRTIDAEGAVFTSQATMLLAHVLVPEVLAAHPPGSRGGMALEWVLNYVFGGCNGADVQQHQQQQRHHDIGVIDANSSFDCFSLANSSRSSASTASRGVLDTSDADSRSDGVWRTGNDSRSSSSARSSGRWNVNKFEYGDEYAEPPLYAPRRTGLASDEGIDAQSDGEAPGEGRQRDPVDDVATGIRVEYVLAACFTRCHPLMTVIGCVAENNQYNCGRTVAQAVLRYAFTLSQTSARLLRTPLLTSSWSTPFTEAMMRGLSELAAHVHQSVSVTPALGPMAAAAAAAAASGAPVSVPLACSFASSAAAALSSRAPTVTVPYAVLPPHLVSPNVAVRGGAAEPAQSLAPLLAAQFRVPTSVVSNAMQHWPRRRAYAFVPPPADVVTGTTAADESEVAQVRTMRRCLALHWAKCVLLSARTLTRAGTYDVAVPYEHYTNIRGARLRLRGRMAEYRSRMQEQFEAAHDEARLARLHEVFERWDADERRLAAVDAEVADDLSGSFAAATVPQTQQGTPEMMGLYTVNPSGHATIAPAGGDSVAAAAAARAAADASAAAMASAPTVLSHFDSYHTSHAMTANSTSFASPVASRSGTTTAALVGGGSAESPQQLGAQTLAALQEPLPTPQEDSSQAPSITGDPLGRSADPAASEKESHRRAFVDSFCFGKTDLELLSANLLGRSRNAVQVPIHIIVFTSLFSILDAMGDVLLCEKPRLSTVVANELLTLLYEAQLSMLEPLHDGAMAVVERTGSTTSSETESDASSASSCSASNEASASRGSLSGSFALGESPTNAEGEHLPTSPSDGNASHRSDEFTSPASSPAPPRSLVSRSSSVSSSSDDDSAKPIARGGPHTRRARWRSRDPRSVKSKSTGASDGDGDGGAVRRRRKRRKKAKKGANEVDAASPLTRDGHILLFNEYALLLEAGLRSPVVVRRWRGEVKANPDHAARGYASLLYHLQLRHEQWADPTQEEYLVSRSTLRLMLGVTARDARGNIHGNILHVDDLDVMGSRKEEVAPRLGVTSSKDSLATAAYSEEWDPAMVETAETVTAASPAGSPVNTGPGATAAAASPVVATVPSMDVGGGGGGAAASAAAGSAGAPTWRAALSRAEGGMRGSADILSEDAELVDAADADMSSSDDDSMDAALRSSCSDSSAGGARGGGYDEDDTAAGARSIDADVSEGNSDAPLFDVLSLPSGGAEAPADAFDGCHQVLITPSGIVAVPLAATVAHRDAAEDGVAAAGTPAMALSAAASALMRGAMSRVCTARPPPPLPPRQASPPLPQVLPNASSPQASVSTPPPPSSSSAAPPSGASPAPLSLMPLASPAGGAGLGSHPGAPPPPPHQLRGTLPRKSSFDCLSLAGGKLKMSDHTGGSPASRHAPALSAAHKPFASASAPFSAMHHGLHHGDGPHSAAAAAAAAADSVPAEVHAWGHRTNSGGSSESSIGNNNSFISTTTVGDYDDYFAEGSEVLFPPSEALSAPPGLLPAELDAAVTAPTDPQQQQTTLYQHHHLHPQHHHSGHDESHVPPSPTREHHRHAEGRHGAVRRRNRTRVVLAGPRGDLGTMVARMPNTWLLSESLESLQQAAEEREGSQSPTAAAAAAAGGNTLQGDATESTSHHHHHHNSHRESGSGSGNGKPSVAAPAMVVYYTPVHTSAQAAAEEKLAKAGEGAASAAAATAGVTAPAMPPGTKVGQEVSAEGPSACSGDDGDAHIGECGAVVSAAAPATPPATAVQAGCAEGDDFSPHAAVDDEVAALEVSAPSVEADGTAVAAAKEAAHGVTELVRDAAAPSVAGDTAGPTAMEGRGEAEGEEEAHSAENAARAMDAPPDVLQPFRMPVRAAAGFTSVPAITALPSVAAAVYELGNSAIAALVSVGDARPIAMPVASATSASLTLRGEEDGPDSGDSDGGGAQLPLSFHAGFATSAPLSPCSDAASPCGDVALNRAIHRVLQHRRNSAAAAGVGVAPSSFSSLNAELGHYTASRPTPAAAVAGAATVPPRPRTAPTRMHESGDSASLPQVSGVSQTSASPSQPPPPPPSTHTDPTVQPNPRRLFSSQSLWNQTLSQLRRTTAAATAYFSDHQTSQTTPAEPPEAQDDGASSPVPSPATPTPAHPHDPPASKPASTSTSGPDATRPAHPPLISPLSISTSGTTVGSVANTTMSTPDSLMPANLRRAGGGDQPDHPGRSDDAERAASPFSPVSAHDLQWYTGKSVHRPVRSTVSTDNPTSPTQTTGHFSLDDRGLSADGYALQPTPFNVLLSSPLAPPDGVPKPGTNAAAAAASGFTAASPLLVPAGALAGLRIGQGGGRPRLWSAAVASRGSAVAHPVPPVHGVPSSQFARAAGADSDDPVALPRARTSSALSWSAGSSSSGGPPQQATSDACTSAPAHASASTACPSPSLSATPPTSQPRSSSHSATSTSSRVSTKPHQQQPCTILHGKLAPGAARRPFASGSHGGGGGDREAYRGERRCGGASAPDSIGSNESDVST